MYIPSQAYPGQKYPLGATWTGEGVNFSVFSENAALMVLCLFDENHNETSRINMRWNEEGVWHCFLPQAQPGLRYGYRAHGTFDPHQGLYFNPNKLLLDPYAKNVAGEVILHDALYGYEKKTLPQGVVQNNFYSRDMRDSALYMLKGVVVDDKAFDWEGDRQLGIPLDKTVLYEVHVKGFSKLNPALPPKLRGTYAGLAHPASIDYLRQLGVTSIELLPIHLSLSEGRLDSMGLSNYWGYNTLGFFCPDPRFCATSDPVSEFKSMVKALHKAGLEVILDVVYNHTAEQGYDGPHLSWRGLDNPTYYRLDPQYPHNYLNFTGCGNSLDTRTPTALQMVADSLRYWVQEMHVDGFRFDLATTLARTGSTNGYHSYSSFLSILHQDPILNRVKLIAEPWDCGPDGYQVGRFPKGWSEWNGDWRDVMRRYWRGEGGLLGRLASKLSGSSDLYWNRSPLASINFITAHDGFTLWDLVSYQNKRNQANGEDNRDGTNDNYGWNCGVEGPTSDPQILNLRLRQARNMLLSTILSQGVPMLLGGDEIARTQRGNNNAYCQDNELSYYDWKLTPSQRQLYSYTQTLLELRRLHPAFRRQTFFSGQIHRGSMKDVLWLSPSGQEMQGGEWDAGDRGALGMYIAGDCLEDTDEEGNFLEDSSFLLLFNNGARPVEFALPSYKTWAEWELIIDTYAYPKVSPFRGSRFTMPPHSAVIFQERPRQGTQSAKKV